MDILISDDIPIIPETNVFNVKDYGEQLSDILKRQSDVNDIINTENVRLTEKEKSVDDALYNKQRLIDLNYSYTKRNEAYTRLIIIFVIILASLLFLNIIEQRIPAIPSFVTNILSSILIFTAAYNMINIYYYDIYGRNNMNYDQLDFNAPKLYDNDNSNDNSNDTTTSVYDNDIEINSSSSNNCYNSDCCSKGTKWNDDKQVCVSE